MLFNVNDVRFRPFSAVLVSRPMDDSDPLHRQAEKIRANGVLGQSRILRLFNFLVESSSAGTIPKEVTIAAEVFGKTSAFDVAQDSIVRVYIHNLRRKLDQYYAGPGLNEPARLALPKGEYRLALIPRDLPPAEPTPASSKIYRHQRWMAGLAIGSGILLCVVLVGLDIFSRSHSPWQTVRTSQLWSRLLQNGKPIVIVLGDYYIFGDTDRTFDVKRLVREFSINSKDDLEQYLQMNPDKAENYLDVGLGYLPTSSAFALADITPMLASSENHQVRVMLMSALDPSTIKSANIVYIGLLSGLGVLQKVVFAGSRFHVGESFDELIDDKTQHHYVSGSPQYDGGGRRLGKAVGYYDYGFFSTFSGLEGNQIVIIAATQDEGLRRMTQELTNRVRLDALYKDADGKADLEALFEIFSMDNLDFRGKLLVVSPLNPNRIWTAR